MKIAVIGASGNAGSRIVTELARRGHAVTAIARHPEKIKAEANVTPTQGDLMDQAALARLLAGHDAAISSVHFLASDPAKLIGAARDSKVGRYLVVGGAGSLEVAPGVRLVTTPGFPVAYKAEAEKGAAFLDLLRAEKELNWTFLSPSALFTAGERTGKFRLGTGQLLTAADGKSWISFEDFAIALADEIERPQALHGWLLRQQALPITLPGQGVWGGVSGGTAYIVCHNPPLYKARADGQYSVPPCT